MKLLDIYFKRPVLYDYIISAIISGVIYMATKKQSLSLPNGEKMAEMSSDIGAIGLTVSGFILTLLTILVTLKNNEDSDSSKLKNNTSSYRIFFKSNLYFRSVDILRYAVISLVSVSIAIYGLKLFLPEGFNEFLLYANIIGIFIIFATFFRCLFILKSLILLQKPQEDSENDNLM